MESNTSIGKQIYNLAEKLWPINRSITGEGVRKTLAIIKEKLPELIIKEYCSGETAFDWTIPDEWNVEEAYIINPDGEKIVDFNKNNLHLVGYSIPIEEIMELEELQAHLYSIEDQPDSIPYITSYYSKRWGFCITHNQKNNLKSGRYKVVIKSSLKPGVLNIGEIVLPGKNKEEVFLSTYICHPSLANNELSGPCVTTFLAKWLKSIKYLNYTYRIIFIPETIGSIVYLNENINYLKKHVKAGYVITCIGDDRCFSYLPSREGDTLSDIVAQHVLLNFDPNYKRYSFIDRGSDERQYCFPGIDLPMATIMRSKYGEYLEYHTSLDNLSFISPTGLEGGYNALMRSIEAIEKNVYYIVNTKCEPQLGKRGLYPTLSTKGSWKIVQTMMNLLTYCDGKHSLLDIAIKIKVPIWELYEVVNTLLTNDLISLYNPKRKRKKYVN